MLETVLRAPRVAADEVGRSVYADLELGGERRALWAHVRGAEVSPRADAWAVAVLLPAMRVGHPLRIEGELSPRLFQGLDEVQEMFRAWRPELRRIEVTAEALVEAPAPGGRGVGSFFSAGLDSFYTALRHRGRLEALIHVLGFDIWEHEVEFGERVRREVRGAAQELGLRPIEVDTNLHAIGDEFVSWEFYHGHALACIGLLLTPSLREVLIPASWSYNQLSAWGSHPLVDPHWSSEATEFVHDGLARRVAKCEALAGCDVALARLRVCFDRSSGRYNCGLCEKCLRTTAQLEVAGVLARCKTLPDRPDLDAIRRLRILDPMVLGYWQETLDDLERRGGSPELGAAIRTLVRRNRLKGLRRSAAELIGPEHPILRSLARRVLERAARRV
jgi:hypothetical protein